jgi:hypothetical protein
MALFKQSDEFEPNQPGKMPGVKTNPSLVYERIVDDYRHTPPAPDWNSVYVMTEK